jgi:signal transduction histidine kinase
VPTSRNIFQTSTFRLAAIYLVVFALSVASILGYVYYNTISLLERQTEETIRAEVLALADQYRIRGLTGIVDVVNRRSKESRDGVYLLADSARNHIAGNLTQVPKADLEDETWIDFPITVGNGADQAQHTARVYHVELAGDYELLVGRDVQELRQFRELIQTTLFGALGMSLVLGLGGGYVMSRNFLRRVDAITQSSHIVMAGDLSGRMPITGSGDELDRLAGSLNEMLSQIERLMVGMKDVTSNVAHDLKTPLTRMKARVEAALRSDNKADYRGALRQTIEECDGLLRTFNALLSIAQAESGQQRQALERLDINEILRDVVELYEPISEESGGTLTLQAEEGLQLNGNRQLIAQAVSNLIDNAMKYGEGEKQTAAQILVQGKVENNMIEISVADQGTGIPAKDRDRVRDRFVRLDESRSKPGNGLGLSLVASVMTLHGGKLSLEDNTPGLRAVLRLPRLI